MTNYTIAKHQHRFAAWAASRAASTSPKCRFHVHLGMKALEACGFDGSFTIDDLPAPDQLKDEHANWRDSIIDSIYLKDKNPSHGVAAKLINTYMKSRFVLGGFHADERVKALHPPIDSVLLKELKTKNVGEFENEWKRYAQIGWSNFSCAQYEEVIELIQQTMGSDPLWQIESYWLGYRSP